MQMCSTMCSNAQCTQHSAYVVPLQPRHPKITVVSFTKTLIGCGALGFTQGTEPHRVDVVKYPFGINLLSKIAHSRELHLEKKDWLYLKTSQDAILKVLTDAQACAHLVKWTIARVSTIYAELCRQNVSPDASWAPSWNLLCMKWTTMLAKQCKDSQAEAIHDACTKDLQNQCRPWW